MGRSLEVKKGDTADVLEEKDEEHRWEEERRRAEEDEKTRNKVYHKKEN